MIIRRLNDIQDIPVDESLGRLLLVAISIITTDDEHSQKTPNEVLNEIQNLAEKIGFNELPDYGILPMKISKLG